MRTLTIVITGEDAQAAKVRQIAASWTGEGLLQESVWLTADDAVIPQCGPPAVSARLLGDGGEGELQDLFTLIAVRRLDLVRVVVLQLLPHGEEHGTDLLGVGLRVAELVKGSLPRDITVTLGAGTSLMRANLLVPESGTGEVSQDLLAAGWEVNAIASPEDRPDLHHASIFVRRAVNLHAHAVAAVACVGGLWPGVPEGAFDDIEVDSTSGETDLVVFRPSARLLLGDELPLRLADGAMALLQDPSGEGASAFVSWAAAAQNPDQDAATAHSELVEQGEWALDPLREMVGNPKAEMSIGAAFGDLARFQGRLVLAAGRVVRNTATRWVEDTATHVTVGSEGDYVVRVEPRTPDELVKRAQERLNEQTSSLESGMLEREAVKVQPPLPSTWSQLRQLCFGLVDGSTLPTGFTTPERASTRELLPPRSILPHPEDTFTGADGTVVGSVDIAGAAELLACSQLADGTTPDAQAEHEDALGEADEHSEHEQIDGLEQWVLRRENTLIWRLGSTLWRREREAGEAAQEAYTRAAEASTPSAEGVRRARTRLLACWALIGLGALGVGIWAAVRHWITGSLTLSGFAGGLGVLVLIGLVLALYGGWQYYRALSRFERQVQHRLAERRHAGDVFVVATREARRLGMLYEGVRDWARIIGWVLHEPWVPATAVDAKIDRVMDDLPASVAVAVPADDADAMPSSLTFDAINLLCNRGWIRQIFDDLIAADVEVRGRRDADTGHLPADIDAGIANHGDRQHLMNAVGSTDLRMRLADLARARVAAATADGRLPLPEREVVRLGDYASPETISNAEFFRGALGPATPFVEEVWTDQGLQDRCHLVALSRAWIPSGRGDEGGDVAVRRSVGDSSVRVDVSRPCTPSQVALFDSRVPAVRPVITASGGWV